MQETIKTRSQNAEGDLENVIEYISRENATDGRKLVSGINCSPDQACKQMKATKKRFGKEGGVTAYHGYQSFKEGEVNPVQAHLIGVELASRLWGDQYEVLVATHVDKETHIHNHFVLNTVSFVDGKKYHRTKEDYRKMQETSDRLCRKYGLSVVRHPEDGKGKHYSEWAAEKNGKPTYRNMIRKDIDAAIKASITEKEFFAFLKKRGYEFKIYGAGGKELERPSLKPRDSVRYFRFERLGEEYSLEEIRERILENIKRKDPFPEEERQQMVRYREKHPPHTKKKGLAALYYYYCYELHILERYPLSVKRVSSPMREDIRKLEQLDMQARFLGENNIESQTDLLNYRKETEEQIRILEWERQVQRNQLKRDLRSARVTTQIQTKMKIGNLSEKMKLLRKNLVLCDKVENRSARIEQNYAQLQRKIIGGRQENELFRGSGGAGRENVLKWD